MSDQINPIELRKHDLTVYAPDPWMLFKEDPGLETGTQYLSFTARGRSRIWRCNDDGTLTEVSAAVLPMKERLITDDPVESIGRLAESGDV